MTQLLISVRSLAEAKLLPIERIGILDVKEPRNGPLGLAEETETQLIINTFAAAVPVSAAFGELIDFGQQSVPQVAFAKFGLSGLADRPDWKTLWQQQLRLFPKSTQPVAVIYADWQSCQAPSPEAIFEAARDINARTVLVDTFSKTDGNVFSQMSRRRLKQLRKTAVDQKMKFVLAGGLRTPADFHSAFRLQPDYVGVRGAICPDNRKAGITVDSAARFFDRMGELLDNSQNSSAE